MRRDDFHLHHLTIQIEPRLEEQRCVPRASF
jgi:hypothetical protein